MVNCSVAHLFDHNIPPPAKVFFSRPLVPLLFWAPGPKSLGVKTSRCRGRGGLRSPRLPFPLTSPPLCPPVPETAMAPPQNPSAMPRPLLGKRHQTGSGSSFFRGPGKLPNSPRRPNRGPGTQGQTVPSRKESGLRVTTSGFPGRAGPPHTPSL